MNINKYPKMSDQVEKKKCGKCKVNLPLKNYDIKRDDEYYKFCKQCITYTRNYKCEHDRIKSSCKVCNLSGCIRNNIISRMYKILGYSNLEYLGCTIEEFMAHIEGEFKEGMTWQNFGEWHIDHIKPLSVKGLTEEEIIERFEFTNTQPLWAADNIRKHNKEL